MQENFGFYSGAFNTKTTRKKQGTQGLILKMRYKSGGFKIMTIIDFTINTKKQGTYKCLFGVN